MYAEKRNKRREEKQDVHIATNRLRLETSLDRLTVEGLALQKLKSIGGRLFGFKGSEPTAVCTVHRGRQIQLTKELLQLRERRREKGDVSGKEQLRIIYEMIHSSPVL